MSARLQITFHGISRSPALTEAAARHLARLERKFRNLLGCSVVIAQPHHHQGQGNAFSVKLDFTLAGNDVLVNHSHDIDAHAALSAAFEAAERQLRDRDPAGRRRARIYRRRADTATTAEGSSTRDA